MIEVTELNVKYGNIEALHGISFRVNEGEIVALLGANGAGKSTTLMSIMRLPPPEGPQVSKGEIKFRGSSILQVPTHVLVSRYGIGLVPEGRHIFGNLTVFENLKLATYARKDSRRIQKDYRACFCALPAPCEPQISKRGAVERRRTADARNRTGFNERGRVRPARRAFDGTFAAFDG